MNDRFFNVSQNGRDAQDYPHRYLAVSNTGIHSGFDLDNNGVVDRTPGDQNYGGDAFGFGEFPGKYAMVVFSKYPIDTEAIRTFEEILWKDMPGNLIPPDFYTADEQEVFRISSKSHWDIPIEILGTHFHFLVSVIVLRAELVVWHWRRWMALLCWELMGRRRNLSSAKTKFSLPVDCHHLICRASRKETITS